MGTEEIWSCTLLAEHTFLGYRMCRLLQTIWIA